jgi:hypothetical protein
MFLEDSRRIVIEEVKTNGQENMLSDLGFERGWNPRRNTKRASQFHEIGAAVHADVVQARLDGWGQCVGVGHLLPPFGFLYN